MRAFAILIAAHALVACSYDQHLGDPGPINCAANPDIELVWNRNSPSSVPTPRGDFTSLAADGTNVYWHSYDSIMKVPKDGGATTLLAYAQAQYPGSIAVDETNVYWASEGSAMAVPIGGGRRTILVSSTDPMSGGQVAVRPGSVYFADGGRLWRVDL